MGSSAYHYKMKRKYLEEANKYGRWLKSLRDMRDKLTGYSVTSNVSNVCSLVKRCASHVESGLKGESMYAANAQLLWKAKEQEPLADSNLRAAYDALTVEINRVTALKREAEKNRDYHARKYKEALLREAAEKAKACT